MEAPSVFVEGVHTSPEDLKTQYLKRGVNPDRMAAIRRHAGKKVLDVGCGSGAYIHALVKEKDIYGLDYQAFETWKPYPERFQIAQGDNLPYPDDSFDTLLSFETLEHLLHPEKALREYHRVTRGNLILTVPNCTITPGMKRSNLLYSHWGDPTHVNFFTLATISQKVEEAGFRIKEAKFTGRINPLPFFLEYFQVTSPRAVKWATKLANRFASTQHYITCLVVGEKALIN